MKKSFKWVLMLVIAIVSYLPISVSAQDISQADFDATHEHLNTVYNGISMYATSSDPYNPMYHFQPGKYKLTTDIDLQGIPIILEGDDFELDLNGKKITYTAGNEALMIVNANVIIKGNGKIESTYNYVRSVGIYTKSKVTIMNGDFVGGVLVSGEGSDNKPEVNIKSGTYKFINVSGGASLVIDNANVDSTDYNGAAIGVSNGASLTINDGVYKGINNGIIITSSVEQSSVKSVVINEGAFIGGDNGMFVNAFAIEGSNPVKIKKASFIGNDSGIRLAVNNAESVLNQFLAEGSYYSPDLEVTKSGEESKTQKEISVLHSNNSGSNNQNEVVEDTEPKFLDGENQELNIGKDSTITFRINVKYDVFSNGGQVYVDDKLVDSKYYSLGEGSTIITLQNDFVKNLSVGEHTFTAKVNDTELSTMFKVLKNDNINPQTGDEIFISLIAVMVCVAGAFTFLAHKKKKVKSN